MGNTTNSLADKSRLRQMIDSYGVPRMIITGFLLLMFVLVPFAGVDFATQISNVINRFSWNAIMVLAMVPMVHSGCGLNFGLPLGIISGLLGATLSIELGFTGPMSFVMAIAIATPFALLLGGGYGWLLNKIKGGVVPIAPKWVDAAWQTRVGCAVEVPQGMPSRPIGEVLASDKPIWELKENKSVEVNRNRGSFAVATERTCGGFVPNGKLTAGRLAFDAGDDLATIWVSSSDGKPLASSERMVLTHLTDSIPDGSVFADERRSTLISWGIKTRQSLVRRARAAIALQLDARAEYEVYGLDLRGVRTGRVASEVQNGALAFTADVKGPEEARLLYEIVRKAK